MLRKGFSVYLTLFVIFFSYFLMRWFPYSAWETLLQPRNKLVSVTAIPTFWLQPPRTRRSLKKLQ